MEKELPIECENCKYKYVDKNGIEWCKDINAKSGCKYANSVLNKKE